MTNVRPSKWLVIMVKDPIAGAVKTRLGRDLGVAAATNFYRHAMAHVVSRLNKPGRWQTVLAVAPDRALLTPRVPEGLLRMSQGAGDLGMRLQSVVNSLPPGPVIIIGSDCPGISGDLIDSAFRKLGSHDAVIGSSPDGGYWLIGLKRFPKRPNIFQNVRWSTPDARQDTQRNMRQLRVAEIRPLLDVDTGEDLRRVGRAVGRRILPQV